MVSTEIQDKNIVRFKSLFDHFEQQLNGHRKHPIHEIRRVAASHLEDLRFPTRRDEDYKYTSFARVLNQEYGFPKKATVDQAKINALQVEGLDAYLLVFVNGILDESLSHLGELEPGLSVQTVSNALKDAQVGAFVEEKLSANAKSDNPFVVLNSTFAEGGVFVHVAKNALIEKPIHFIQYNTATDQAFIYHPQRLVKVEQGAQVSFIDSHYGEEGSTYFSNVVNVFEVGANTQVKHFKLQTESENAFQVNNTTAYQAQDSTYTNLALDLGGRIVRNNLSTIHQGQNVTSNLYGALLVDGDQHVDNQTFIDHAIPHCQSNELYKAVLDGKSTGVFNGKVMVRKDAQKTNAYQQNAALVLSEKANMDSKPQLEIYADDVKCSHGATIGQLDQTSMFYLRSRGMNEAMAKQTLQYAFLIDVLEEIDNEAITEKAEALIYQKFSK